jgi:O-antigen ligase
VAVTALCVGASLAVALAVGQRIILQRDYQPDPARRVVFADAAARGEGSEGQGAGKWDATGFHPGHPALAFITIQAPFQVSSTFGSWNTHGYHPSRTAYAGFLALALPFALALWATARRRTITVWMGLLCCGVAVSVLAGYVVPALLLGIVTIGIALGQGRRVLLGVLLYALLLLTIGGFNRTEVVQEPLRARISAQEAATRYDGERHLKKFWGEQQAALNLLRYSPLFGVGGGQYQRKIADGYDRLGPVSLQRLESDAQNGYLLAAVNYGIVGLIALIHLYMHYFSRARQWWQANRRNPWAAAALGAMVAVMVLTAVTSPWVRGTALLLVAVFAIVDNHQQITASREDHTGGSTVQPQSLEDVSIQ